MTDHRRRPIVTTADLVVFAISGVMVLLAMVATGFDHRAANNALSVLVIALLCYRLMSTWHELTVLEHALVFLAIGGPLAGSVASLGLSSVTTVALPENPWLWLVTFHRIGCIILAVWWRRWLGRRHSPFRRTTGETSESRATDQP